VARAAASNFECAMAPQPRARGVCGPPITRRSRHPSESDPSHPPNAFWRTSCSRPEPRPHRWPMTNCAGSCSRLRSQVVAARRCRGRRRHLSQHRGCRHNNYVGNGSSDYAPAGISIYTAAARSQRQPPVCGHLGAIAPGRDRRHAFFGRTSDGSGPSGQVRSADLASGVCASTQAAASRRRGSPDARLVTIQVAAAEPPTSRSRPPRRSYEFLDPLYAMGTSRWRSTSLRGLQRSRRRQRRERAEQLQRHSGYSGNVPPYGWLSYCSATNGHRV